MSTYQKNRHAVRRFGALRKAAAWIQAIPERVTPPPFRLLQIGSAFWQSKALYLATKLDIAGALEDQAAGVPELAQRLGVLPEALFRLLRLLTAMGLFDEVEPGVFSINNTSKYLLRSNPRNVRAMILMHNSEPMSRPWEAALEQSMYRGDTPFKIANGTGLFDYMDEHPEFATLFSAAMDTSETLIGNSYVTDLDWGRFHRVIDIGGSQGSKSASILAAHRHMSAIVVDRSEVVLREDNLDHDPERQSVRSRMSFAQSSVFGELPMARDEHDVYLLSAVLHAFSREQAVEALRNIGDHCADTGARIVILDLIMPDTHADLASASFDMQMFMGTPGKERTLKEWLDVIDASGMQIEAIVSLRSLAKALVLRTD